MSLLTQDSMGSTAVLEDRGGRAALAVLEVSFCHLAMREMKIDSKTHVGPHSPPSWSNHTATRSLVIRWRTVSHLVRRLLGAHLKGDCPYPLLELLLYLEQQAQGYATSSTHQGEAVSTHCSSPTPRSDGPHLLPGLKLLRLSPPACPERGFPLKGHHWGGWLPGC